MENQIRFTDDMSSISHAAIQRGYAEKAAEQAVYSAIFKKENDNKYSGPALVKLQNGEVISQESMPIVFDPMPEIKKEQADLNRYTIARNKKEAELKELREKELYSQIETAAKYHREYSAMVEKLELRLKNLKVEAPAKIEKSIIEIKNFMQKLEDAKIEANAHLEAAKGLKASYEGQA